MVNKYHEVHDAFHCSWNHEYSEVENELKEGVDSLEEWGDSLDWSEYPDWLKEDFYNLLEVAREVANNERPLEHGIMVTTALEFGLGWMIDDYENGYDASPDTYGYAPDCRFNQFDDNLELKPHREGVF